MLNAAQKQGVGSETAQYNLALNFREMGDFQQALFWFKKAALQNYVGAQYIYFASIKKRCSDCDLLVEEVCRIWL